MVFSAAWSVCLSAAVAEPDRGVPLLSASEVGVDAVCLYGVATVEFAPLRRRVSGAVGAGAGTAM
jgi:hypothetical protein